MNGCANWQQPGAEGVAVLDVEALGAELLACRDRLLARAGFEAPLAALH